jgi:CheY-like chemotaxis protein
MTKDTGTILLVDDDETVLDVLSENLSQQGFETIKATNGEEGVGKAIQCQPDLIVSDIVMPQMDGWEFCYALRLMPSTRDIPFVFLTSLDKTPDKILGIKLGADDYLTKPFKPAEVIFKVKAILKRVQMRQRLLEEKEAEAADRDAQLLLSDVIEYLRHSQRTGLIAVFGGLGKGVIYIRQGEPVHASIGPHRGETAVMEILKMESTQIKYFEKEYQGLEDNLSMKWQNLMDRLIKQRAGLDES